MAISVKKTSLWRREVDNTPGTLARSLEPLANAGNDLEVVMAYGTGNNKAVIELAPISGKRATATAEKAGFSEARVPAVVVTGDNRPGTGHTFARAIADGGINLSFLVAHVVGSKFSSVFGFESEADADRAIPLIKNAASARRSRTRASRMPSART